MLCKTITPISSWTDTYTASGNSTVTQTYTYQDKITEYKFTVLSWRRRGLTFQFDDVTCTVSEAPSRYSSNVWVTVDLTQYAKGASNVTIKTTYDGDGGTNKLTINYKLWKQQGQIIWKPKDIREIWDLTSFIFYGVTNNNYIGGVMLRKSDNATTGSITLGNAVGFITVNLNWEIVKIPYYWN